MYCGKPRWLQREVKGVLLDITGVLYNGGEKAEEIPDSIKAVQRWRKKKQYAFGFNRGFN